MKQFRVPSRILCLVLSIAAVSATAAPAPGPLDFPELTREAKPWTWWWWMGNAVDETNLTRILEEFSEAGLGGVQITPIYGVKGQEDREIEYLSPRWLAMLAHTTNEAARLGLGVDMSTGTGWPFGGPTVTLEDADAKVSIARVDIKQAGDSLGLPEGAILLSLMAYKADGAVVDLTDRVTGGVLTGTLAAGEATYYVVYYRFSGRRVKRAAPGGAGFSINPFSKAAVENYLDHFAQAMADFSGKQLRGQYHDSFEYGGDWAPELWAAFEAQHGYDLRHHLPEMMGEGDPDTVARIKSDYRETLADLLLNGFARQWVDWSHQQGALTRYQAHGSTGNLIDLYATADTPETEIFGPSGFPIPGLRKDRSFE
ncbi:MAG: hypothetical protein L3K26_15440, partial [Candidatus Hydrogenedentes bacterium]|nr:hypothetical protein [Candidatus Hydrogenedentota bacterium]